MLQGAEQKAALPLSSPFYTNRQIKQQMEKMVSKEPVPIITVIKDIVVVLLSIIAIIISIKICSKQNQSNDLAQNSNKIATEANRLATEASESSLKFDIINAETQWGILRDAYDEIDNRILTWENSKNLKRDGKSVDSIELLETQLEKLKVPSEIRRLYKIRHEKYKVLVNVSDQYKPFKERLAHIDFILPSAPVLPQVTLSGVSGVGISIK